MASQDEALPMSMRQAWPVKVIAEGFGMDDKIFVYHIGQSTDPVTGDRFECIASVNQMHELPADQATTMTNLEGIPFYRTNVLEYIARSATEAESIWKTVVEEVEWLVKNWNSSLSLQVIDTAVISEERTEITTMQMRPPQRIQLSYHAAGILKPGTEPYTGPASLTVTGFANTDANGVYNFVSASTNASIYSGYYKIAVYQNTAGYFFVTSPASGGGDRCDIFTSAASWDGATFDMNGAMLYINYDEDPETQNWRLASDELTLLAVQPVVVASSPYTGDLAWHETNKQFIAPGDVTQTGWLSVSQLGPGARVPNGARFYYNIGVDGGLQKHWPPLKPFEGNMLIRNGIMLPYGIAWVLTDETVWWLDFDPATLARYQQFGSAQDASTPWSTQYVSRSNPGPTPTILTLVLFK